MSHSTQLSTRDPVISVTSHDQPLYSLSGVRNTNTVNATYIADNLAAVCNITPGTCIFLLRLTYRLTAVPHDHLIGHWDVAV